MVGDAVTVAVMTCPMMIHESPLAHAPLGSRRSVVCMLLQESGDAEEEILKLAVAARPDLCLDGSLASTFSAGHLGKDGGATKAVVIHAAWPEDRQAVLRCLTELYPSRCVRLHCSCSVFNPYIHLGCMCFPGFLPFILLIGFGLLSRPFEIVLQFKRRFKKGAA